MHLIELVHSFVFIHNKYLISQRWISNATFQNFSEVIVLSPYIPWKKCKDSVRFPTSPTIEFCAQDTSAKSPWDLNRATFPVHGRLSFFFPQNRIYMLSKKKVFLLHFLINVLLMIFQTLFVDKNYMLILICIVDTYLSMSSRKPHTVYFSVV